MKIVESIKKNTIVLLIITMVVLFFVLKDDFAGIMKSISNINIIYIVIAIILYILSVTIKGLVNYLIINDKEKVDKREAIRQNFIAQFFNGITPFQTGGEPVGVYLLTERKIPVAKATNYMVLSFIFYQIPLVLCGLIAVVYNFVFKIFPKVKLLQHLVLVGFIINIIVVLLLLLTYSKAITKRICSIAIKINKKLKLKYTDEEIEQKLMEYNNGLEEIKGRKKLVVVGILLNMLGLICLYAVPFVIILGTGEHISLMDALVSSAYVYLIGAFVPIPGASGGIEYGFTQFFGNFISANNVSAVLIIWRFITYYCGIIAGAIIFNIRERENK